MNDIKAAIDKTKAYGESRHDKLYAENVAYTNVIHTMDEILLQSKIIKELYDEGKIGIVGGMFTLETGRVHFIKEMFSEKVYQEQNEEQVLA